MSDSRYQKTADILVNYSCSVKKGDVVEVSAQPNALPLFKEVVKLCYQKGAFVHPCFFHEEIAYLRYKYAHPEVLAKPSPFSLFEAKNTDVFISLDGRLNTSALNNIDPKRIQSAQKANIQAKTIVIGKRWVIFDYPSSGLAQEAGMSLEEYENFVFDACLQDWNKITAQCQKLGNLMAKTKKIRIIGKETDLSVNIENCPPSSSVKEKQGQHNMPDGEVFTSPQRPLTEGHIYFPWPSKQNKEVSEIRLVFKKGKVVKATAASNEDYLHEVLKTDKLSSSLGEVAIGMNYGIKKYTNNILFDEKIGGTIHIALGAGYKEVGGDPNSAVHWDLVKNLQKSGEVWFDNKMILKNGKIII